MLSSGAALVEPPRCCLPTLRYAIILYYSITHNHILSYDIISYYIICHQIIGWWCALVEAPGCRLPRCCLWRLQDRSCHILPFQPILWNRYLPSEPVITAKKNSPKSISEGGRIWRVWRYRGFLHPVPQLGVWVSKGLTQADSEFSGVGILMSVEFDRGSPGKFDSRTLKRETLDRWTGRISASKWQSTELATYRGFVFPALTQQTSTEFARCCGFAYFNTLVQISVPLYILQRGVQWKQGVVIRMLLYYFTI